MKFKTRNIFRIGCISSIAMAVIAAVFYSIAYSSDYDTTIRHFEIGSVTCIVFAVFYAISAVVTAVSAILMRRRGKLEYNEPCQIETFTLLLTAFLFLAFGILTIIFPDEVSTAASPLTLESIASVLIAPLSIISAVSFILPLSEKLRASALHGVTTFAPILWGTCLVFKYYFDLDDMPLNDPELALTIAGISSLIIFMLSESRSVLGMNSPAIAFFGNCLAVCLGGTVATIRIVLSLVMEHSIPPLSENILFFTIGVLAFVRLLVLDFKLADGTYDPDHYDLYVSTKDITENDKA